MTTPITINSTDNLDTGRVAMNANFTTLFNSTVYSVLNYGAVGNSNGTLGNGTDDTAAFIASIAAIPVDKSGILYIPTAPNGISYRITSTITIPKNVIIRGDGKIAYQYYTMTSTPIRGGTVITYEDDDTPCFSLTTGGANNQYPVIEISDLVIRCVATTPVAGSAGILSASVEQCSLSRVTIDSFYINMDITSGFGWTIQGTTFLAPKQYGIRWKNSVNHDIGWIRIINSDFVASNAAAQHAFAAIYMQGAGAVWMDNVDVNAQATVDSTTYFRHGFYADFSDGQTSEIKMMNSNITNYLDRGFYIPNTIAVNPAQIQITNCNFAPQAASCGPAIDIAGNSSHHLVAVTIVGITGQNTPTTADPFIKLDFIDGLRVDNVVQRASNWLGGDVAITNCTNVNKPMNVSAVNSVSPTSPNRTITVEIDGTTYYIAAKTTNN